MTEQELSVTTREIGNKIPAIPGGGLLARAGRREPLAHPADGRRAAGPSGEPEPGAAGATQARPREAPFLRQVAGTGVDPDENQNSAGADR